MSSPTSSTWPGQPGPHPPSRWEYPPAVRPHCWPPPERGPGCPDAGTRPRTTSRRSPDRPCGTGSRCVPRPSWKASPRTPSSTRCWPPCPCRGNPLRRQYPSMPAVTPTPKARDRRSRRASRGPKELTGGHHRTGRGARFRERADHFVLPCPRLDAPAGQRPADHRNRRGSRARRRRAHAGVRPVRADRGTAR